MEVSIHTHDYIGTNTGSARTQHQAGAAVLQLKDGEGGVIAVFGPETAKDAFDQIAALFNDCHKPAETA